MSYDLRDYQHALYEEVRGLVLSGSNSILLQLPTGSGKTVLGAKMLGTAASKDLRAWFVVHRRELVKQSITTFVAATGQDIGVVANGFPGNRHLPIQICSIGTLKTRCTLLPDPRLILWDECHHVAAKSWDDLHQRYPNAIHIGLTATPERLDGRGLGKYFQELVVGPSVATLIERGYLSPYRMFAPGAPDLSGVHSIAGDFNKKELAIAMGKSSVVGDVIHHYRKHADGKRMVLFAWSIEASIEMASRFNASGIPAEHVDGTTNMAERDSAMDRFKAGSLRVLCNVDLFGEGIDVPAIEAVALLRPTQSLALYMQQVGRALRPAPGKEYAVILDHAGNCMRFGMPDDQRQWSLEGRKRGKAASDASPIRQCPQCYAVMSASAWACVHCGHKFESDGRSIEEVAGELSEVVPTKITREEMQRRRDQENAQATTLEELIAVAKLRNYKNPDKWAHAVYSHRMAKKAAREAQQWLGLGAPGPQGG